MAFSSSYVGVSRPHLRGHDCGWVAQKKASGLYRARFPTAKAAAEWLAHQLKVPLESLRSVPRTNDHSLSTTAGPPQAPPEQHPYPHTRGMSSTNRQTSRHRIFSRRASVLQNQRLAKRPPVAPHTPLYNHVVFHNGRWRAMHGAKVLGRHRTQLAAAKQVGRGQATEKGSEQSGRTGSQGRGLGGRGRVKMKGQDGGQRER